MANCEASYTRTLDFLDGQLLEAEETEVLFIPPTGTGQYGIQRNKLNSDQYGISTTAFGSGGTVIYSQGKKRGYRS
jgi:hypothetical protein